MHGRVGSLCYVNLLYSTDTVFLATLRSPVGWVNPIIFDDDVINPGGHYSTTTGKYTVPYDGIYQFAVHLQDDGGDTMIEMLIDDALSTIAHRDYLTRPEIYYRSTTVLQELTAGQTVHVGCVDANAGGAFGQTSHLRSYFSGYMISAN